MKNKTASVVFAATISSVIVLTGCGSSSSKTHGMVNTGNSINELGYYGTGVVFGNEHIVGVWRFPDVNSETNEREFEFYGNGTMYDPYDFADINMNFKNYGVSEDGKTLIVDNTQYIIIGMTNCYDVNASYVDNGEWIGLYEFCKLSD